MSPYKFILHNQTLWLSHERCIFWEEEKALILSDLHLGKTGHFRKSGIGVPQNLFKEDLQRLFAQIQFFKPKQLVIVGDLFHSYANKEMDMFLKWRTDLSALQMRLIKGNHDILAKKFYIKANIEITKQKLSIENFCFTHDINETCDEEADNINFTFSGHVHPGIYLSGMGKQSLRFPCFYFTKDYAILPAFSHFTGLYKITPKKGDNVFALVEDGIVKIQS
ncbi:MAG: ligase-associated DNA damage response endonuclease PdeM [Bacteroidota bacterium]|nr:ligase-associated DNA damage response endonuclease PdeM [Bacteroidota bacterium]